MSGPERCSNKAASSTCCRLAYEQLRVPGFMNFLFDLYSNATAYCSSCSEDAEEARMIISQQRARIVPIGIQNETISDEASGRGYGSLVLNRRSQGALPLFQHKQDLLPPKIWYGVPMARSTYQPPGLLVQFYDFKSQVNRPL
ncbi:predicted protein [Coccidioides posadasii str. Silveira]|uniref:Predicted protein n=2 Tax=Coccidioides posadasii TaxID=199306 RepID=E9CW68_COCPS|nr:predicted protein [Coccidioides posadasii str. Silveira]KMM65018.1 hypothetical protein CPAG_01370 [Coccidioides posadasii RMSCC 3488]